MLMILPSFCTTAPTTLLFLKIYSFNSVDLHIGIFLFFTEEINLVTEAAPKANRLDLLRLILHVISNQYLIKIFKNNLNHPGD